MFFQPTRCPNPQCQHHAGTSERFFIKKGYFKTKWNAQPVPRYRCRACGRYFSTHSFRDTFRQHKPHVNLQVFRLLASGVTLRRIAIILGIAKVTVERKMEWLALRASEKHQEFLASGELKTSYIQFDEMETYEHTKLKPLSIALAIRGKTGQIIDARVATMNCHGKSAEISRAKYGWRIDTRQDACRAVMETVKSVARDHVTVSSDAKKIYPSIIREILPHAGLTPVKSRTSKKEFDPLFRLNHTAAKIRADLSRMARRTWATTKKPERLQAHLAIYIAWTNKYDLSA